MLKPYIEGELNRFPRTFNGVLHTYPDEIKLAAVPWYGFGKGAVVLSR